LQKVLKGRIVEQKLYVLNIIRDDINNNIEYNDFLNIEEL